MADDPDLWRATIITSGFAMPEVPAVLEDEAISVSLFEIEDEATAEPVGWRIDLLFREAPEVSALAAVLADAGIRTDEVRTERVEPEEWARAAELKLAPVVAGRFVVHGSHARDAVPREKVAIEIDAGLAFGSGEHATTQACLAAIDRLARRRRFRRVLDVGCGSAVLAIAAAKCWPGRVLAVDNDPIAVRVARVNVANNGVADRIRVEFGEGYSYPAVRRHGTFDLILANILADPLIELAPDLRQHLAAGGHAVLSGLLDRQAPAVIAAHRRQGLELVDRADYGPWVALVMRSRGRRRPDRAPFRRSMG